MIISTSFPIDEFDFFSFVDAKATIEEKLACALRMHCTPKYNIVQTTL